MTGVHGHNEVRKMIDKFHDYLEVIAIIVFLLAGLFWLEQEFGSETEARTGEPGLQLRLNRVDTERMLDTALPRERRRETGNAVRGPIQEALRVGPRRPQTEQMVGARCNGCGRAAEPD